MNAILWNFNASYMNTDSQNISNGNHQQSPKASSELQQSNESKKLKKRNRSEVFDIQEKENIDITDTVDIQKRRKYSELVVPQFNVNNFQFSFVNNNTTMTTTTNNNNILHNERTILVPESQHSQPSKQVAPSFTELPSISRKRDRREFEDGDDMIMHTPTPTTTTATAHLNWFGAASNEQQQQDSMEEDVPSPLYKRMRTKEQEDEEERFSEEKKQLNEYLMKQQFRHYKRIKENELRALDQAVPDYQDINTRLKQIHMERKSGDKL